MATIAINGFGRIGRCALRHALDQPGLEVVGVNDLADPDDLAYLFRYDSIHGPYRNGASLDGSDLVVGDHRIPMLQQSDPSKLPWGDLGADVIVESTGAFRSRDAAAAHLEAGAAKVLISAPSDDADVMIVPGVNDGDYDAAAHHVLSMASCTTNCVAPVLKVLDDAFGVDFGFFTTAHAYTASQSLVDIPARKRRRGRAAAISMIPTTTGAAQAAEVVLPNLAGKLDGMAIRVPIPNGSVTDLVAGLDRSVTAEEVVAAFRQAAGDGMQGILEVSDDGLVSIDIVGDRRSAIVDAASTRVLRDRVVKVLAWYDNEWGYAARLVELASRLAP